MDIPEKLATVGNQDTRPRQTKQRSATEYVMNTTIHKTQCRIIQYIYLPSGLNEEMVISLILSCLIQ